MSDKTPLVQKDEGAMKIQMATESARRWFGRRPPARPARRWSFLSVAILYAAIANVTPLAGACGGSPAVTTDKPDYGKLETAQISGSGFECGQALSVLVTAPDGTTRSGSGTGSLGPDTVITDG